MQLWREGVSDAKRLRSLETENSKLKRLVAELTLDNVALKDVLLRKWRGPRPGDIDSGPYAVSAWFERSAVVPSDRVELIDGPLCIEPSRRRGATSGYGNWRRSTLRIGRV